MPIQNKLASLPAFFIQQKGRLKPIMFQTAFFLITAYYFCWFQRSIDSLITALASAASPQLSTLVEPGFFKAL